MAARITKDNAKLMRSGKRPPEKRCEWRDCPDRAVPRENYCDRHLKEIERWR
jgi:hypothetical protein